VRVLHAIHDFLPRHRAGSEIYAFNLCRELADRHDVSVVCADYDPVRQHGHVTWRLYDGLPVIEITNNWQCESFRETYQSPVLADRLEHVLRAVQPDVVHVHNLLNLSFDLPSMARRHGAKVVATLHDYTLFCPSGGQRVHVADEHVCHTIDPERCVRCFRESPFGAHIAIGRLAADTAMRPALGVARKIARRFPSATARVAEGIGRMPTMTMTLTARDIEDRMTAARSSLDLIDVIVAPSASIASEFTRLGVNPSKIRTMDYGFVPLARRGTRTAPPARLRIGYVGTLVWHKGVHALIDAVRRLPSSSYELKIFGDVHVFPRYVADLRRRADGLPVRFMGKFDERDTADVYRQFDVLVVPSLWLENSPLVIHEAFMAGVPVVGARIGGIADLVEDGRTGLLYDPAEAGALAAALRSLLDKPQRLQDLGVGVQTRTRVRSMAEDAEAWNALYDQVRT
jgi:glycosyltransferase involved in cell wall biosynthesis